MKLPGRRKKAVATLSGAGSYSAKPGKRITVKLTLSKAGRSIVRRGRTTAVSVQLTPKGAKHPVATRTVRLRG